MIFFSNKQNSNDSTKHSDDKSCKYFEQSVLMVGNTCCSLETGQQNEAA